MSNVDWEKIKAEYLAGGTSYRILAEKYGLSKDAIARRAGREGWVEAEKEVRDRAATKAQQKIVTQRAKDIEKLDRLRSMAIDKLAQSLEKFPDIPGSRMEQTVSEIILPKESIDGVDLKPKKPAKHKTVRVESDLAKMVSTLEKLMAMTGYSIGSDGDADDGFLEALNAESAEVTEDASDIPEDL